jgi:hypothetical protein
MHKILVQDGQADITVVGTLVALTTTIILVALHSPKILYGK